MIKLYWCPLTRASRAMWLLEEIGCDYELVHVDVMGGDSRDDPAFRAASPMGKVPALDIDGTTLWDSSAISLYLADRFPDAKLAPGLDDPLRARYLFWMVFTPGMLEPALMEKFYEIEPNKRSNGWGDYDSTVNLLLDGLAQGPWLLGERFSAADILVGSSVCFLRTLSALPEHEALAGYAERCLARPAYQQALAKDEEFAPQKERS